MEKYHTIILLLDFDPDLDFFLTKWSGFGLDFAQKSGFGPDFAQKSGFGQDFAKVRISSGFSSKVRI